MIIYALDVYLSRIKLSIFSRYVKHSRIFSWLLYCLIWANVLTSQRRDLQKIHEPIINHRMKLVLLVLAVRRRGESNLMVRLSSSWFALERILQLLPPKDVRMIGRSLLRRAHQVLVEGAQCPHSKTDWHNCGTIFVGSIPELPENSRLGTWPQSFVISRF